MSYELIVVRTFKSYSISDAVLKKHTRYLLVKLRGQEEPNIEYRATLYSCTGKTKEYCVFETWRGSFVSSKSLEEAKEQAFAYAKDVAVVETHLSLLQCSLYFRRHQISGEALYVGKTFEELVDKCNK